MKIFIDDLRAKPDKYDLKFESGEELLSWIDDNKDEVIELLSLDHDLNEGFMDGTELCRKLVEIDNLQLKSIQFHSDNYQGIKNMYSIIASAKKVGLLENLRTTVPYKINVIDGIESKMTFFDLRKQN